MCSVALLEHLDFAHVFRSRPQMRVPVEESRARIPPQPRIVVAGGAEPFGALEVAHSLGNPIVDTDVRAGATMRVLRLGPALRDDARVVRLVVW